jgi:hypothetical protein
VKGVERHYISFEDILKDAEGNDDIVKVGLTLTYNSDSPEAELRASNLCAGVLAHLSTTGIVASLQSGVLT